MMATTRTRTELCSQGAQNVLRAAVAAAELRHVAVCVAVSDCGGHPLALLRMDACGAHASYIAMRKACAAAVTGAATGRELPQGTIDPGLGACIMLSAANGTFVALEGGEPVLAEGQVAGGVGVSGATEAIDREIARIAAAACAR
ncbi:MAG: hypothetical protein EA384_07410 [Spirochaetaceae bacterium]|nr:MAG: hypothetical protein EA384_07410 [Spirochaetaceae bacterium]